jgi:hypothetical protein
MGQERFGHTRAFKSMEKSHIIVHESVLKNMIFVNSDSTLKNGNPQIIHNHFTEMEKASSELFKELDAMLEEYLSK